MASMDSQRMDKNKLFSPAAERNKEYILKVLQDVIPSDRPIKMLEIASGSGQHAAYLSSHLPNVTWQPSECDQHSFNSIAVYRSSSGCPNLLPAILLDVCTDVTGWGMKDSVDVIMAVNMIHISPWAATQGLFRGAGHHLKSGGKLLTYGPFAFHGQLSPESNIRFDASLRQSNSEWGVRDVDDLQKLAQDNGLKLESTISMPANNFMLIFSKL